MIRHAEDHPTFKRIAEKVEAMVIDAEITFQKYFLAQQPHLVLAPQTLQDMVEKAKIAMRKRLRREFGLHSAYVAH